MPTPGTYLYGGIMSAIFSKKVDWLMDTIKVALVNGYTFDQENHDFFNDITNEISGGGYTAGGVALTGKTAVYDGPSGELALGADDPAWVALTNSMTGAVMYGDTGSAATSPLLAYYDFGGIQNSYGVDFSLFLNGGVAIYAFLELVT